MCNKVQICCCLIYTQPVDQSSRSRASRTSQNPSSSTANNERTLPTQARTSASASLPVLEMNETETTRVSTEGAVNSRNSKVQKIKLVGKYYSNVHVICLYIQQACLYKM